MFLPTTIDEADYDKLIKKFDTEEQVKKLVYKCVHAFIVLNQKRLPIKRADVTRVISDNPIYSSNLVEPLFALANKELIKVFGLRLFKVDKATFLLVNTSSTFSELVDYPEKTKIELSVLFLVLLSIFSSPVDRMTEEQIISGLSELNMKQDEIMARLESFHRRMYIQITKSRDCKEYSWGPRATAEIDIDQFFKTFIDLNSSKEADWPDFARKVELFKSKRSQMMMVVEMDEE